MKKKKVAFHNLGCKVNAYETEAMQQMLEKRGYEIVPFDSPADVYIINTCTVTNIADRKSRQMLHRAKKLNPQAIVVAAGCYAQAAGEELAADEAVDIVIGNNRKKELADILEEYEQSREACHLLDVAHAPEYETLSIAKTAEHTRAYIKVQDGCNQFCSYCIIPYARGRIRSRDLGDVLDEVRTLAENGYQEVVLTGIHLSSYGKEKNDGVGLLQLIEAVHEVDGIRRIRLGSLEPRIITEEFAQKISRLPKICPHFHLSLQSGCDATLKRMNRHYTAEEYYEKCVLLRSVFDDPALTTDVIVGFPGETEEEFSQTVAFLEKVKFYETHIFKYSRRRGTRAAAMENQIPEETKSERSQVLQELNRRNMAAYEARFKGRQVQVLFEEKTQRDGREYYCGHTREYISVTVPNEGQDLRNKICDCIL
ncbi:MAG: tRNA (N(6)-L-threonylcarbamoyladenosine(37)-C(2))-methylthiotransferase MtaB [Marvinbryantia sp.]|uniref:tRNA (N(6)-L-threonylcarbamoyladenosine(37)-C(2))- methylthiotransferase MtaB n=2 Tax=Marvinbryantia sp. TaxID=2496532 RepID=UPI0025EAE4C4|nr:tRNA (N(6)-L-threonylcarbamoyladenosine(37)-C(2))-methylthiotransferase MtaB [uncultured Marvinbryantia sp.]